MSDTPADAPPSTRLTVLIPFAIVTLIWGSTWIVIRDQLGVVPPSWSVTYRFVIAGLAMLAWAAWRGERLVFDRTGYLFAAVFGFAQFALNFNFVYRAEAFITSGLVAVVFALLVVPNAVLGWLFLGQRVERQFLAGSGVAMAGIALLFVHEVRVDPSGLGGLLTGVGLTCAGVLAASIANIMQATEVSRRYPMAAMLGVAMLLGAVINGLWALGTAGPPVIEWRLGYLFGVAYLGLAASAIAFTLYFGVIREIGPAKAAYSSVIVPVIAMLLSTIFEGYRWSPLAAIGSALAMGGLVLALRARKPAR